MSKRTAFLSYEQSELDGLSRRPWTLAVHTDFITLLYRLYLYLLLFQEDNLLRRLVEEDRVVKWCDVSAHFSGRTGKQCSERSATCCSSALQRSENHPQVSPPPEPGRRQGPVDGGGGHGARLCAEQDWQPVETDVRRTADCGPHLVSVGIGSSRL